MAAAHAERPKASRIAWAAGHRQAQGRTRAPRNPGPGGGRTTRTPKGDAPPAGGATMAAAHAERPEASRIARAAGHRQAQGRTRPPVTRLAEL